MVQRLTYRRRHGFRTKSNKVRKVKTPGGKLVFQYLTKKSNVPRCGDCGMELQGIPAVRPKVYRSLHKRERRVSRAYGGSRCAHCVRQRSAAIRTHTARYSTHSSIAILPSSTSCSDSACGTSASFHSPPSLVHRATPSAAYMHAANPHSRHLRVTLYVPITCDTCVAGHQLPSSCTVNLAPLHCHLAHIGAVIRASRQHSLAYIVSFHGLVSLH